mmetsp:Transcript_5633/g.16762  ORF Transcript_5633/g.16762 Transcript_5633/m.16762 type:complete len:276 (+) Transcript_5633:303-1130(+)
METAIGSEGREQGFSHVCRELPGAAGQDDVQTATWLLLGLKSYTWNGSIADIVEDEYMSGSVGTETGSEIVLMSGGKEEDGEVDVDGKASEDSSIKKRRNDESGSTRRKQRRKLDDGVKGQKSRLKRDGESRQSLSPSTNVACKVKDDSTGDTQWILGSVVQYFPDTKKYQVLDVGDSEDMESDDGVTKRPKYYNLSRNKIRVLPEKPNMEMMAETRAFAVYPNTTVFYPATVRISANTRQEADYLLEFDDEDEEGEKSWKRVPAQYVLPVGDLS